MGDKGGTTAIENEWQSEEFSRAESRSRNYFCFGKTNLNSVLGETMNPSVKITSRRRFPTSKLRKSRFSSNAEGIPEVDVHSRQKLSHSGNSESFVCVCV